MFVAAFDVES
jgi:hypothetical protein